MKKENLIQPQTEAPMRRNIFREHNPFRPWCGSCPAKVPEPLCGPIFFHDCTCLRHGILLSCTDSSTGTFEFDRPTLDSERMNSIKNFVELSMYYQQIPRADWERLLKELAYAEKIIIELARGIIKKVTAIQWDGKILGRWEKQEVCS